jgi:hypothetical protein
MADKQIEFTAQEQMRIEAIVIDQDKAEALKYLATMVERFKGTEGHICGPKWSK